MQVQSACSEKVYIAQAAERSNHPAETVIHLLCFNSASIVQCSSKCPVLDAGLLELV